MAITDEAILQIADKLGMATEEIYTIFVGAQPILAMIHVVCAAILVLLTVGGYFFAKKYIDENDMPTPIGGVLGTLIGMIVYGLLYHVLRLILLPEYSAIVELIKLLIPGSV